ncbi:hypothetical protein CBR_g52552 [Chara braunii]|uniref:Right handed beta helix domain-containing protein n=1 Tax=Chara braunii TaxID=69332 RepID=A0A388MAB9_CHABU|nr:hypothetical protein CBR_g52552 [Chara braunii]|eukprot:GBG91518.1 hypothetical protein CBR_g52552 [Chara braunii]
MSHSGKHAIPSLRSTIATLHAFFLSPICNTLAGGHTHSFPTLLRFTFAPSGARCRVRTRACLRLWQEVRRPCLRARRASRLVLLSLDGYGGGVKAAAGVVAAAEARRGLSTSMPTPEARLRAAMTNPNTTIVRLTFDIRLTSDLPYMTCLNLTVIGNCRTDFGLPRLCQINGGDRFGGFAGAEEPIILTLQNVLMSHFTLSKENPRSVIAGGGTIVVKNCLFQNNTGGGGVLFGAIMSTVTIENSTFIGNNGTAIGGTFLNVYLKEVVFRSNIGGSVISLNRGMVDGERCEFEANAGGAVSV